MIFDDVDLLIIREFCKLKENEETTTWKIMRKIYKKGSRKEHQRVVRRIDKMSRYGIFNLGNNSKKTYTLIKDFAKYKKIKFEGKIRNFVCINMKNKWELIEL